MLGVSDPSGSITAPFAVVSNASKNNFATKLALAINSASGVTASSVQNNVVISGTTNPFTISVNIEQLIIGALPSSPSVVIKSIVLSDAFLATDEWEISLQDDSVEFASAKASGTDLTALAAALAAGLDNPDAGIYAYPTAGTITLVIARTFNGALGETITVNPIESILVDLDTDGEARVVTLNPVNKPGLVYVLGLDAVSTPLNVLGSDPTPAITLAAKINDLDGYFAVPNGNTITIIKPAGAMTITIGTVKGANSSQDSDKKQIATMGLNSVGDTASEGELYRLLVTGSDGATILGQSQHPVTDTDLMEILAGLVANLTFTVTGFTAEAGAAAPATITITREADSAAFKAFLMVDRGGVVGDALEVAAIDFDGSLTVGDEWAMVLTRDEDSTTVSASDASGTLGEIITGIKNDINGQGDFAAAEDTANDRILVVRTGGGTFTVSSKTIVASGSASTPTPPALKSKSLVFADAAVENSIWTLSIDAVAAHSLTVGSGQTTQHMTGLFTDYIDALPGYIAFDIAGATQDDSTIYVTKLDESDFNIELGLGHYPMPLEGVVSGHPDLNWEQVVTLASSGPDGELVADGDLWTLVVGDSAPPLTYLAGGADGPSTMTGVTEGLAGKVVGFNAASTVNVDGIGNTITITSSNGDPVYVGPITQFRAAAFELKNTEEDVRAHYHEAIIRLAPNPAEFIYVPGAEWSVTIDGRVFSYTAPNDSNTPRTARTIAKGLVEAIKNANKTFTATLSATGSAITITDRTVIAGGVISDDPFTIEQFQSGGGEIRVLFDIDKSNIFEGRKSVPVLIPYPIYGLYGFGGFGGFLGYGNFFNPWETDYFTFTSSTVIDLFGHDGGLLASSTGSSFVDEGSMPAPGSPGSTLDPFLDYTFELEPADIPDGGYVVTVRIGSLVDYAPFSDRLGQPNRFFADKSVTGVTSRQNYDLNISIQGHATNDNAISLVGKTLTIVDGTGKGQSARIGQYDPELRQYVLDASSDSAFAGAHGDIEYWTTPDRSSKFEISFKPSEEFSGAGSDPDFDAYSPVVDSYEIVLTDTPDGRVTVYVEPRRTRTLNSDLVFDPDANFGQNEELQVNVAVDHVRVELAGQPNGDETWTITLTPVASDGLIGEPVTFQGDGESIEEIGDALAEAIDDHDDFIAEFTHTATEDYLIIDAFDATGAFFTEFAILADTRGGATISQTFELTGSGIASEQIWTLSLLDEATGVAAAFDYTAQGDDDLSAVARGLVQSVDASAAYSAGMVNSDIGGVLLQIVHEGMFTASLTTAAAAAIDLDSVDIELAGQATFDEAAPEIWKLTIGGALLEYQVEFRDELADIARALRFDALEEIGDDYNVDVFGRVLTISAKEGENLNFDFSITPDSPGSAEIRPFLVFDSDTWSTPETVTVIAIDDDIVDGGDALVFGALEQRVNAIRGPVAIEGGIRVGEEQFLNNPVMLPGETNFPLADGSVAGVSTTTILVDIDGDGTLDEVDAAVLTDPNAIHANARTGERLGFDPRMNDYPYSFTFVNEDSENVELDVDSVSGDILSVAKSLPFSVGLDMENSPNTLDESVRFVGVPVQVLNVLDAPNDDYLAGSRITTVESGLLWDQAMVQLTGYANVGETWSIKLGGYEFSYDVLEGADVLGRIAKGLAARIEEESDFEVEVRIGLLGDARLFINGAPGSGPFSVDSFVVQPDSSGVAKGGAIIGGDLPLADLNVTTHPHTADSDTLESIAEKLAQEITDNTPAEITATADDETITILRTDGAFTLSVATPDGATALVEFNSPAAATLTLQGPLPTDGDEWIVTLGDSIGATGWTEAAFVAVSPVELNEQWTLRFGDESHSLTVGADDDVQSVLDLLAGEISSGFLPLVSGTQVTFQANWPDGVDPGEILEPGLGSEYFYAPLNPNFRVIETDQVDTLNVFHGDSPSDDEGLLTEESLTGLGMGVESVIGDQTVAGGIYYAGLEAVNIELGSGDDELTIASTHQGSTNIKTGVGVDTIDVQTISGHTAIDTGPGLDTINVGSQLHLLDQITALLTIDGGDDLAALNLDDSGDADDNEGVLTDTTLTGLDMPTVSEVQSLFVQAASGDYLLRLVGGTETATLNYLMDASQVEAELAVLFGVDPAEIQVVDSRTDENVTYRITFVGLKAGSNFAQLEWAESRDGVGLPETQLKPNPDASVNVVVTTLTEGSLTPEADTVQTLTIDAESGTFSIDLLGESTGTLAYDVTVEELTAALEPILNPNNSNPALPYTDNFSITQHAGVFHIAFRGEHSGLMIDRTDINPWLPDGSISLALRVDGVNYYNVDTLNVELGSGHDAFNVQGTSSLTNVFTGAGDDRIYVSSAANVGRDDYPDFLRGDLDDIAGMLNLDAGSGRNLLMISDEASVNGDNVVITDTEADALAKDDQANRAGALRPDSPDAPDTEIYVVGLAAGTITYRADTGLDPGDFSAGVTIWSGFGDDKFTVDGTHLRSDVFTVNTLNTGLGSDTVDVTLLEGSDEFFVLNAQGPYNNKLELDADLSAGDHRTPADSVKVFVGSEELGGDEFVIHADNDHVGLFRGFEPDDVAEVTVQIFRPVVERVYVDVTTSELQLSDAFVSGEPIRVRVNGRMLDASLFGFDYSTNILTFHDDIELTPDTLVVVESQALFTEELFVLPQNPDGDADIVNAGDSTLPLVIFGGQGDDVIDAGANSDIVFADRGRVLFFDRAITDEEAETLSYVELEEIAVSVMGHGGPGDKTDGVNRPLGLVLTINPTIGGLDTVRAGKGRDIVFGGYNPPSALQAEILDASGAGDVADDIIIGDSGRARFVDDVLVEIFTTDTQYGGDDLIIAGSGSNYIFGGAGKDDVRAGGDSSADVIVGDNGRAEFTPVTGIIELIKTYAPQDGDDDLILAGDGPNVIIGGSRDDRITAGDAPVPDVIIGDNGKAVFVDGILLSIETIDFEYGGNDTIFAGNGPDVVLGGAYDDKIIAGLDDADDVVLGDDGLAIFTADGVLVRIETLAPDLGGTDEILVGQGDDVAFGGGQTDYINVDPITLANISDDTGNDVLVGDNGQAIFDAVNGKSVLREIRTSDPLYGDDDFIFAADGSDVVFGGSGADIIHAGLDDSTDVVVGDNGQALFDPRADLVDIGTTAPGIGGDDRIVSGAGADVVFGGQGNDFIDAGSAATGDNSRDVVVGDNGLALFASLEDPVIGQAVAAIRLMGDADGDGKVDLADMMVLRRNLGQPGGLAEGDFNGDGVVSAADLIVLRDNLGRTIEMVVEATHAAAAGRTLGDANGDGRADLVDMMILRRNLGQVGDSNPADFNGNGIVDAADLAILRDHMGRTVQSIPSGVSGVGIGLLREVRTTDPIHGGDDVIITGDGPDVVLGGSGNDQIDAGGIDGARDIVMGDNGYALFDPEGVLVEIRTIDPSYGGDDDILVGQGDDVVFGGKGVDYVSMDRQIGQPVGSDCGNDVIVGDNGYALFDSIEAQSLLRRVETTDPLQADGDFIYAANGSDVVLGGGGDDFIDAGLDAATDVVVGDNGKAIFDQAGYLIEIRTTSPEIGGDDYIVAGAGTDVVFGGQGDDYIDAGSPDSGDGSRDLVLGDNGMAIFDSIDGAIPGGADVPAWVRGDANDDGRVDLEDAIILRANYNQPGGPQQGDFTGDGLVNAADFAVWRMYASGAACEQGGAMGVGIGVLSMVASTDPLDGGDDYITTGGGKDVAFGGTADDEMRGGDQHDILLGDHGLLDYSLPANQNFRSIFTTDDDRGGDDTIYGDGGDDFILGQQGDDRLFGGDGEDDMTGGHNVLYGSDGDDTMEGGAGADVMLGDNGRITRTLLPGEDCVWIRYPDPFPDVIRHVQRYDDVDLIGGDDLMFGGSGDDIIHGQRGDDEIHAGQDDDEIYGELGDDDLSGDEGQDVVIGGGAIVVRDYNDDGRPRINESGAWHRDVFLEDIGVITGVIDIDTTPLRELDPDLARKLIEADFLIATGALMPDGSKVLNPDNYAWDTDLLLVDLTGAEDDELDGGDGVDLIFGQRGDDIIRGGGGDDVIFADGAFNTVPFKTDLPQIVSGIRLISIADGADVPLLLEFGGSVIVPAISIRPEEFTFGAPGVTYVSDVVPMFEELANNDALMRRDGAAVIPYLSVVPDIVHHVDVLPGNDIVDGGDGADLIFGDDARVFSSLLTGMKEIDDAVEALTDELFGVLHSLHHMALDYDLAEHNILGVEHEHDLRIGNDVILGGDGADNIIGDDGLLIAPFMVGFPVAEDDFTAAALDFHSFLRDLDHVAVDLGFIVGEAHLHVLYGLVSHAISLNPERVKPKKDDRVDPDFHDVIIGNDVIDGQGGDDLLIGDDGAFIVPVVADEHYHHLYHHHHHYYIEDILDVDADVLKDTEDALKDQDRVREDELKDHVEDEHSNFTHRLPDHHDLELIPYDYEYDRNIGNDEIHGGVGNDVIVGDYAAMAIPIILGLPDDAKDLKELEKDIERLLKDIEKFLRDKHHRGHDYHHSHHHHHHHSVYDKWLDHNHAAARGHDHEVGLVAGNDTLFGDDGDDIVLSDNVSAVIPFAAEDPDALVDLGKVKFDLKYVFKDIAAFLHHHHHGHKDFEILVSDTIEGGDGDDVLVGQYGENVVLGGQGDDILYGDKKNDVLDGGTGYNKIEKSDGKAGKSILELLRTDSHPLISVTLEYFLFDVAATGGFPSTGGDASPTGFDFEDVVSVLDVYVYGPTAGVRGQPLHYGAVGETPAVLADNLTQWRVLNSDGEIVALGSGVDFTFHPVHADVYTVLMGSTNGNGAAALAQIDNVIVETYRTIDDPASPGSVILMVGGSLGDDNIDLERGHSSDLIRLELDEKDFSTPKLDIEFSDVSRVVIYGQDGDDDISMDHRIGPVPVEFYGQAGEDKLYGGDGDDLLDGGFGHDDLDGRDGDDSVFGGHGDDNLKGGDGDDTLDGGLGEGRDVLDGQDGADKIFGADGDDVLKGGDDDDLFVIRNTINNDEITVDGGHDRDTLDIEAYSIDHVANDGSEITIDLRTPESGFSTIRYSSIEDVIAGPAVGLAGPDQAVGEQTEVVLPAGGPIGTDAIVPVFDEARVNTTTAGDQKNSSIGVADDGSWVVVWEGYSARDRTVFFQRFNSSGVAVDGETAVDGAATHSQTNPQIVVGGDGRFVVVWESDDANRGGVFARLFDSSGQALGDSFQVNTTTYDYQRAPSVAIASDGGFVIAWEGRDSNKKGVFAQRFDADGNAIGGEIAVNATTSGDQKAPSIGIAADGGFVIAWEGYDSDKKGILAQRFDANGVMVGGEVSVNATTAGEQTNPSVAVAADGGFVVVWEGNDSDKKGVLAQRFDSAGNALGGELQVNTTSSGYQTLPVVAMHPDGRFVVVWESSDADRDGVFAQIYDADGLAAWGQLQVNNSFAGDQNSPSVAMARDGGFAVAWNGVDARDKGVFVRRYVTGDVEYSWRQLTGPGVVLVGAETAQAEFIAPDIAKNTELVFELRISYSGIVAYSDTVIVTVVPDNDAPNVADDWIATDEDTAVVTGNLLDNDIDINGDAIWVESLSQAAHGRVGYSGNGEFSYVPEANYNGPDSFTYTITDGSGLRSMATVIVTVNAVNDAPVAADNQAFTDEDMPVLTDDVLADDTDIDGDLLTVESFTQGANGAVSYSEYGRFLYSPRADFNGTDSFTYTVSDGNGGADTAVVTVAIHPVADVPRAGDDAVATDEDTLVVIRDLLGNDEDVDGEEISILSTTRPTYGALIDNLDGTFTYAPRSNYYGLDSFLYTIVDPTGRSDTATVRLTINSVNDAPQASDDSVVTDEDTPVIVVDLLDDDTDIDGDILEIQSFTQGAYGTVVDNLDGTLTYSPLANYHGSDSFTYVVSDGNGGTDEALVSITVNSVNDAPQAAGDTITTHEDFPAITGDVLANDTDVDGDSLSVQSFTQGTGGTVLNNSDGTFTYIPNVNHNGPDSFTYTITDGNGGLSTVAVNVTITPDNDLYDTIIEQTEVTLGLTGLPDSSGRQPVAEGPEAQINVSTSGDQKAPSVGMASDGRHVVVWETYAGWKKVVVARMYDAAGLAAGGEFQVNPGDWGSQTNPKVAMADDGSFVVAWEGFDSNRKGVFGRRFDSAGEALGDKFLANVSQHSDQKAPTVAIADTGRFVIAWEGSDANKKGVLARQFNADGTALGGEISVNATTSGDQKEPSVAVASDGSFVVAWEGSDSNKKGVFARRFSDAGVAAGGDISVNTTVSGDQKKPPVALASDGGFVVAWEGFDADKKGVFARRFNADGIASGSEFLVSTSVSGDQIKPEIAVRDDGRFTIAWEGPDSHDKGVFAQSFDSDGSRIGDEFRVNTSVSGNQDNPAIAMADDGDFAVVWEGRDADRDGVFAQRYDSGELIYSWTQIGGPTVALSDTTDANPAFHAPNVSQATTLTFKADVFGGADTIIRLLTVVVFPL